MANITQMCFLPPDGVAPTIGQNILTFDGVRSVVEILGLNVDGTYQLRMEKVEDDEGDSSACDW